MPAKDIFHEPVVHALEKDGWTITHDPLTLKVGTVDLFLDLGAERLITAERASERIAVEVKSFVNRSGTQELERAVGQFIVYADALRQSESHADRKLFLAVRETTFLALFESDLGKMLLDNNRLRLVVFDPKQETILRWVP
jgi:hypothetical protein